MPYARRDAFWLLRLFDVKSKILQPLHLPVSAQLLGWGPKNLPRDRLVFVHKLGVMVRRAARLRLEASAVRPDKTLEPLRCRKGTGQLPA